MRRTSLGLLLVSLCTALAVPVFTQGGAAQPPPNDAEWQKLDAVMTFIRNRNARDYAISAPNVIDEAKLGTRR